MIDEKLTRKLNILMMLSLGTLMMKEGVMLVKFQWGDTGMSTEPELGNLTASTGLTLVAVLVLSSCSTAVDLVAGMNPSTTSTQQQDAIWSSYSRDWRLSFDIVRFLDARRPVGIKYFYWIGENIFVLFLPLENFLCWFSEPSGWNSSSSVLRVFSRWRSFLSSPSGPSSV